MKSLLLLSLALAVQAGAATVNLGPALPGSIFIGFEGVPPVGSVNWPADKVFSATDLPYIAKPLPDGSGKFLVSSKPNQLGGVTTITFGADANYLGLTWGSPDDYNVLRFYRGGVPMDFVTGAMIPPSNGDQSASPYVRITNVLFDRVDLESSQFNFEIDNLTFQRPVGDPGDPDNVPEGGAGLAALAGLMGLGVMVRSRRG